MNDEMLGLPETPIQIGSASETSGAPPLAATLGTLGEEEAEEKNYANNKDVVTYIQMHVLPLMRRMVEDRLEANAEWAEIGNMTTLRHDSTQRYVGRTNVYVPVYAKNRRTTVNSLSRGLFPTSDFLSAKAMSPEFAQHEGQAKAWMQHQVTDQAKLRLQMKKYLRQLKDFGNSVGKCWYNKSVPLPQPRKRLGAVGELLRTMEPPSYSRTDGCRFRTVSMFAWYMWPTNVDNIKEATLVFENVQVSKQVASYKFKSKEWVNEQDASDLVLAGATEGEIADNVRAISKSYGLATSEQVGDLGTFYWVQEVYCNMELPGTEGPVPVQMFLMNGVPVLVRRNPFWFQHAPYIPHQEETAPNVFYGFSNGRLSRGLNALVNDLTNQTADNGVFGLNPIPLINTAMLVREGKLAPGSPWYVTDVDKAVRFERPPVEQLQYGLMLTNQAVSWLQDLTGAPPILQGTGGRGAARTATGAQILQTNVKSDVDDSVLDMEEAVLSPIMDLFYALGLQFDARQRIIGVQGQPVEITEDMWAGAYLFQWLASSQSENNQVRNQQSMALAQLFAQMMPLLQANGYTFNPVPMFRRMYGDFGYRDFDSVMPQAPQMMPGMMPGAQPGGQPGMPPTPGQDSNLGVSAVQQANYGQEGAASAPGEGQEFGLVRDNADELAAMMGGE